MLCHINYFHLNSMCAMEVYKIGEQSCVVCFCYGLTEKSVKLQQIKLKNPLTFACFINGETWRWIIVFYDLFDLFCLRGSYECRTCLVLNLFTVFCSSVYVLLAIGTKNIKLMNFWNFSTVFLWDTACIFLLDILKLLVQSSRFKEAKICRS